MGKLTGPQTERDWGSVISRAFSGEMRTVEEKHGTPVVEIVAAEDFERLAGLDARWAEGCEILRRFGQAFRDRMAEESQALARRHSRTL